MSAAARARKLSMKGHCKAERLGVDVSDALDDLLLHARATLKQLDAMRARHASASARAEGKEGKRDRQGLTMRGLGGARPQFWRPSCQAHLWTGMDHDFDGLWDSDEDLESTDSEDSVDWDILHGAARGSGRPGHFRSPAAEAARAASAAKAAPLPKRFPMPPPPRPIPSNHKNPQRRWGFSAKLIRQAIEKTVKSESCSPSNSAMAPPLMLGLVVFSSAQRRKIGQGSNPMPRPWETLETEHGPMKIREFGPAEGPLVVLIHGMKDDESIRNEWNQVAVKLATASFHVIVPDFHSAPELLRPGRLSGEVLRDLFPTLCSRNHMIPSRYSAVASPRRTGAMPCWDRGTASREDLTMSIRDNPGPQIHRRCTDPLWCLLLLAASCATACLVILLWQVGDARLINHGKDHDGNLCGLENFTHTAFIYWPDLATDVKTNPTLALPKLYGVCVSECPQDGQAVTGAPTKPEQVCGLAADGTNQFWLKPDSSIIDGWRAEGASEDLIQSRDAVTYKLFTAITGPAFSYSHAVWENLGLVVGLGVGGAAVLSFAMMLMLPKCAPVLLLLLTILLFLLLIVADYILFVQANIATGRTGARFINFLKNLDISVPSEAESLLDHSSSKFNTEVFALAAFGVALLIAILACLVVSMSRKFGVLIGLFEEAGDMNLGRGTVLREADGQRLTLQYAYIYTAITGQSFIPAAREALHLVCNYSLQVALNEIATWAVGFLIALAVPLVLAALAFLALRESFMTYLACACAVMVLAFLVTHMAMSVYDAIVTSIFVCAMRDEEYCGGQYMDRRLRRRLGFPESQHPHVEIPESLRFRS
eukprot:Skav223355  [mRNA]  locus=scaffold200:478665:502432:+ [translate_table: standard]